MDTGIAVFQKEAALPSESELENLTKQAKIFIASGFLPTSIKTPEQAITIAIKGRELGIPPMQAFAHINVIQGKPAMSGELMLALCYRGCPTAVIEFVQCDNKACVLDARRRGSDKPSRFSFNLDDALSAQLLQKDSWKKYPAAMFRARCISAMARAMFPDCLMGVSYTAEELGAEVTIDGEIAKTPELPKETTSTPKTDAPKPVDAQIVPDLTPYDWAVDVKDGKIFQMSEEYGGSMTDWIKEHVGWAKDVKEVEALKYVAKNTLDEAGYKMVYEHINLMYKALKAKEKKAS